MKSSAVILYVPTGNEVLLSRISFIIQLLGEVDWHPATNTLTSIILTDFRCQARKTWRILPCPNVDIYRPLLNIHLRSLVQTWIPLEFSPVTYMTRHNTSNNQAKRRSHLRFASEMTLYFQLWIYINSIQLPMFYNVLSFPSLKSLSFPQVREMFFQIFPGQNVRDTWVKTSPGWTQFTKILGLLGWTTWEEFGSWKFLPWLYRCFWRPPTHPQVTFWFCFTDLRTWGYFN